MDWRDMLYNRLTPEAAGLLSSLNSVQAAQLEEMRFRQEQPAEFVMEGRRRDMQLTLDAVQFRELLLALCGYARYACEKQMGQGYIPLPGGHRAGLCGRVTHLTDGTLCMNEVTSVCIRIARCISGASTSIRSYLQMGACRALVLGAPGCGKTTVLRDAALYLSDECARHVAVVDEREELFAMLPARGRGRKLDVLRGAPKAQAVRMLIRAMAPEVIVMDEIGSPMDVNALLDAARCGVGLLASAHAGTWADVLSRPVLRALYVAQAFDCYLFLGTRGCLQSVYDSDGRPLSVPTNICIG